MMLSLQEFNIGMLQLFIICPFPSELLLRDCSNEKLKLHSAQAANLIVVRRQYSDLVISPAKYEIAIARLDQ